MFIYRNIKYFFDSLFDRLNSRITKFYDLTSIRKYNVIVHDHVILTDTGEVIEFCDPRIQSIKQTIEEVFDISIDKHSLYFYGTKNQTK